MHDWRFKKARLPLPFCQQLLSAAKAKSGAGEGEPGPARRPLVLQSLQTCSMCSWVYICMNVNACVCIQFCRGPHVCAHISMYVCIPITFAQMHV